MVDRIKPSITHAVIFLHLLIIKLQKIYKHDNLKNSHYLSLQSSPVEDSFEHRFHLYLCLPIKQCK